MKIKYTGHKPVEMPLQLGVIREGETTPDLPDEIAEALCKGQPSNWMQVKASKKEGN